jgi:hypothetical protein
MPEPKCPRCGQGIAVGDTVEIRGGVDLLHLDCRQPRSLSSEERILLFWHCWNHAAAKCLACDESFRPPQLGADLFRNVSNLCPHCRRDLTESLRGRLHLPGDPADRATEGTRGPRRRAQARQGVCSVARPSRRAVARGRSGDRRPPGNDVARRLRSPRDTERPRDIGVPVAAARPATLYIAAPDSVRRRVNPRVSRDGIGPSLPGRPGAEGALPSPPRTRVCPRTESGGRLPYVDLRSSPVRSRGDARRLLHAKLKVAWAQHAARVRRANETLAQSVSVQGEVQRRLSAILLRRRIEAKLRDGCLPSTRAAIVTGRPGDSSSCDACEDPVQRTQLMMEVETGGPVLFLHADCFMVWDDARRYVSAVTGNLVIFAS